jgi:hypothetical protein
MAAPGISQAPCGGGAAPAAGHGVSIVELFADDDRADRNQIVLRRQERRRLPITNPHVAKELLVTRQSGKAMEPLCVTIAPPPGGRNGLHVAHLSSESRPPSTSATPNSRASTRPRAPTTSSCRCSRARADTISLELATPAAGGLATLAAFSGAPRLGLGCIDHCDRRVPGRDGGRGSGTRRSGDGRLCSAFPLSSRPMKSLHSRTWLAVTGKTTEQILSDLDLRAGMAVTRQDGFALIGASSDAGWYLIVGDGFDHRLIQEPVLTKLSAGCEVLTCTCEVRNLSSAASGWRNGRRLWTVGYEGEDKPDEVAASGELPAGFAALKQEQIGKSEAEDAGDLLLDPLFEIPLELVNRAVGYRPDEPSRSFDGRFVRLAAANPTLKQRLFGG